MAKITSNEYVKVAWVLDADMTPAQAAAPSATILNTNGVDLSAAIAWQDFALGATDSDDVEDRGITDPGNAVTRGFANFEATLSFFREKNVGDQTSDYQIAWDTFKVPRTYGYLVLRVAEKPWSDAWAVGDRVSVFRFVADVITDDTEGDDAVKFTVNFLPQGVLYPYTLVSDAGVIGGIATTSAMVVGDVDVLLPTASGKNVRAVSEFLSSDSTVVSVSANGVKRALSAGTATITVTAPGTTAPVTQEVTVTAAP